MRERTLKVDTDKLESLSTVYRPSRIAATLNISKQRWNAYKSGKNDMPESMLNALCREFRLDHSDLVLNP